MLFYVRDHTEIELSSQTIANSLVRNQQLATPEANFAFGRLPTPPANPKASGKRVELVASRLVGTLSDNL